MNSMITVFPDYYKEFSCIKGECKHSCCIGWEIDIDPETLGFYNTVTGEMGKRLKSSISEKETPHFILDKNERCPFLNKDNLCDIIINLGSERLCGICNDHPRFKNGLPGRTEIGLGLCCEAAGRLILGKKEPVRLISEGSLKTDDEIINLRDNIISVLQDREFSVRERIDNMLLLLNTAMPQKSIPEWADILLSLERLDSSWTVLLKRLKGDIGLSDFEEKAAEYETAFEQLLIYFIYRHFANAFDFEQTCARAKFAVLGYMIICALSAAVYAQKGDFTLEDLVELARLFSSETEYSDENFDILLEYLF